MTAPPSIRRRLARALLLWAVALGATVAFAVGVAVHKEVDELLDDALLASADVTAELLRPQADALIAAQSGGSPPSAVPSGGNRFAWQIVGPAREVLLRSPGAPAEPYVSAPVAGFVTAPNWRVYVQALGADGRMLLVAQSREERREARFEVGRHAMLATLAASLLGWVLLRTALGHELRPLRDLSRRLAGYDPLQPGATLGAATRAELSPMHEAIDHLAQRLQQRMASERAFSAHAAHALRTPLAGLDAQLAVAQREAPQAMRPRMDRMRQATRRLQQVVTALLTLFRSGAELRRRPVTLAELVDRLPVEGLHIALGDEQARVNADPDLMSAALANLFDNALRHGARNVRVDMPGPYVVRLGDDGPGLDAARRAGLQAALDAAQYEDLTGLGLMLADVVARAHGGRLKLGGSDGDRGFVVEMHLAAAPETA
ncbi:MAG: histidine kinase dimerization/phospho-acceptor domain-containing protein [Burkholderiaceae bacterium]